MSRRARLTLLELGASGAAWAACRGLGTDDWLVVAQQSDETAVDFTERVRRRTRRLNREDARIESADLYAAARQDAASSAARLAIIEVLGAQLVQGGRLTLWSAAGDDRTDAELAAIMAQSAPLFATRHIALSHQSCESEARSGVRHAAPTGPSNAIDGFDFDDVG